MKVGTIIMLVAGGLALSALGVFVAGRTYTIIKPRLGPVTQAVYATGMVESTAEVPLSFEIPGLLTKLYVDEGHKVEKDQLLAELDDQALKANLAQLAVDVELCQQELRRKEALWQKKTASLEQYENAKGAYERAVYALKNGEAKLKDCKLFAPHEGHIIKRQGEVGETLKADEVLLWFAPDTLRITAEVDEENRPKIQVGQQVHLRAPAFPDEVFKGTLEAITPKGDPVGRTYRVRIGMRPPYPNLKIGMTIEANIVVHQKEDALLIPSSAFFQGAVWVVEQGKLSKKKIKVGTQGAEEIEVLEGLTKTDTFVKDPVASFVEGQWALGLFKER